MVTANGPSVTAVSPSRTRTVVADSTGCSAAFAIQTARSRSCSVSAFHSGSSAHRCGPGLLVRVLGVEQQHVRGHHASSRCDDAAAGSGWTAAIRAYAVTSSASPRSPRIDAGRAQPPLGRRGRAGPAGQRRPQRLAALRERGVDDGEHRRPGRRRPAARAG